MATDNLAVVRRFVEEIWNKGNLGALADVVKDRCVSHEPLVGELRGTDALKKHVQMFRTAFPDLRVTIEDIGMSGDRVYTRWIARGTHKGSLMGINASGRSGEIRGITVDKLAAGKIIESYVSYDSLALMQLLGAVPPLDRVLSQEDIHAAPTPRA